MDVFVSWGYTRFMSGCPRSPEDGVGSLRAGVTGSWRLTSNTGVETLALVLWRNSKHS